MMVYSTLMSAHAATIGAVRLAAWKRRHWNSMLVVPSYSTTREVRHSQYVALGIDTMICVAILFLKINHDEQLNKWFEQPSYFCNKYRLADSKNFLDSIVFEDLK